MLQALSHVSVWVRDQDEALEFYRDRVGLTVRDDVVLPDFGNYRWLTVGPSDQPQIRLMLSVPGPPALDPDTAREVLALVAKGALGGGIFRTDDCRADFEALKARGVEFSEEPTEYFYGLDAAFRDPSGNQWRLTQPARSCRRTSARRRPRASRRAEG